MVKGFVHSSTDSARDAKRVAKNQMTDAVKFMIGQHT